MRECLFIWVPKCAGTSIFSVLEQYGCLKLKTMGQARQFQNEGSVTFGHMSLEAVVERGVVTQEYLDRAFKFGFVRNPWSRMVSLWSYLTKAGIPRKGVEFEEFLEMVAAGVPPVGPYNRQGLSQTRTMSEWLQEGSVDFIGQVERQEDFEALGRHLGIEGCFPVLNTSGHGEYRQYYTPETQKIVAELYSDDIQRFKYQF
jgi:hypothetical protein